MLGGMPGGMPGGVLDEVVASGPCAAMPSPLGLCGLAYGPAEVATLMRQGLFCADGTQLLLLPCGMARLLGR
jgi:hypothetical protein